MATLFWVMALPLASKSLPCQVMEVGCANAFILIAKKAIIKVLYFTFLFIFVVIRLKFIVFRANWALAQDWLLLKVSNFANATFSFVRKADKKDL